MKSTVLARTIALCLLAALCEGYDIQAAGVAAAGLRHELNPSAPALGLFFSASGAGLLIGALIGGRASDFLGRKAVLVAAVAAFGVFSLLTSAATDMPSLIGARFLTGVGLGGAMPNLIALAADASEQRLRSRSIAAAYVGMPLGAVIASLVVSAAPAESWRMVFRVGGVAPLLVVPLMIRYLPSMQRARAVVATVVTARERVLQALFAQGRATTTLILWTGFFLTVLTLHLMLNWLPLLLMGRGLSHGHASIAQAAFNLGGAATSLWIGRLLDSRWKRLAVSSSLVALPVVLALIAACPPLPGLLFGLAFLLGGGIISQQVIVYSVVSNGYAAASRGTATGAAVAAGRAGSLVGPLVAASLLAAGGSSAQVLIGVLPIVVICGASIGFLGWRKL